MSVLIKVCIKQNIFPLVNYILQIIIDLVTFARVSYMVYIRIKGWKMNFVLKSSCLERKKRKFKCR